VMGGEAAHHPAADYQEIVQGGGHGFGQPVQ
jgi:hypothetical protein